MTTSNQNYVGQESRQALNPRTSGMAIASFVLGLVGMCFGPTAIIGLVFGVVALHQIKKSEGLLGGRGLALAGTILSAIGLMIMMVIFFLLLPAVTIPVMRDRIDAAKWSEGRAMMGTITTAVRAYCAESDNDIADLTTLSIEDLGFYPGDLDGTYFTQSMFTIQSGSYDSQNNVLRFVIKANKGLGINKPDSYTLDQDGIWAKEP